MISRSRTALDSTGYCLAAGASLAECSACLRRRTHDTPVGPRPCGTERPRRRRLLLQGFRHARHGSGARSEAMQLSYGLAPASISGDRSSRLGMSGGRSEDRRLRGVQRIDGRVGPAVAAESDGLRGASGVSLRKATVAFGEERCNGEVPVRCVANRNQGPQCATATLMMRAMNM